jgi:Ribosomal protein L11 methyltransferase (PrmA)
VGPALPPGLVVRASTAALTRAFAALAPLQPVRLVPAGLLCAPRAAPELAGPALSACPLPYRPTAAVPGWPAPPSAWVAGWYRRSPGHLAAPAGVRELLQAPGEGFGPHDHPSTALCLEALGLLPPGPALDAGCGSGLLGQAWARLGRGPVLAVEADPAAADQAWRSLRAADLETAVHVHRGLLERLPPAALAGRVLLANLPAAAHAALLARLPAPPPGALLSGLRPGEAAALLAGYRRLGLRVVGAARRGRFERWALVRG